MPNPIIQCPICFTWVTKRSHTGRQRYCLIPWKDGTCADAMIAAKSKAQHRKKSTMRTCGICKIEFPAKGCIKYCSDPCRDEANREHQRKYRRIITSSPTKRPGKPNGRFCQCCLTQDGSACGEPLVDNEYYHCSSCRYKIDAGGYADGNLLPSQYLDGELPVSEWAITPLGGPMIL